MNDDLATHDDQLDRETATPGGPSAPAGRSRRRLGQIGLVVVLLGLAMVFNRYRQAADRYLGHAYDPPLAAADFTLTDMHGGAFRLADASDQARLVFFGYTSCPDVCPNTLSKIAAAIGQLDADDRQRVKVLFVSVDPERDDAARLGRYLTGYGPEFLGLTGSLETLQAVAASYFVTFYDEPAGDGQTRLITHSGTVFLIDRRGGIPTSYVDPFDPATLAHDLKLALR